MIQFPTLDQWHKLTLAEQILFWSQIELTSFHIKELKEMGLTRDIVNYVDNRTPNIGHMMEFLRKHCFFIINSDSSGYTVEIEILDNKVGFDESELVFALLKAVTYVLKGLRG